MKFGKKTCSVRYEATYFSEANDGWTNFKWLSRLHIRTYEVEPHPITYIIYRQHYFRPLLFLKSFSTLIGPLPTSQGVLECFSLDEIDVRH